MKRMNRSLVSALLLGSVLAFSVTGCGERPKVLPQGTPEQQAEDVRAQARHVVEALEAGRMKGLIEDGSIFLPLAWRKQQKENVELDALAAKLKGHEGLVIGEVQVAGRWALLDGVSLGGESLAPADAPVFMLYYAGQWRWLPSSIMKDSTIVGVMDRNFDVLWAQWQARRPATQQAR